MFFWQFQWPNGQMNYHYNTMFLHYFLRPLNWSDDHIARTFAVPLNHKCRPHHRMNEHDHYTHLWMIKNYPSDREANQTFLKTVFPLCFRRTLLMQSITWKIQWRNATEFWLTSILLNDGDLRWRFIVVRISLIIYQLFGESAENNWVRFADFLIERWKSLYKKLINKRQFLR